MHQRKTRGWVRLTALATWLFALLAGAQGPSATYLT